MADNTQQTYWIDKDLLKQFKLKVIERGYQNQSVVIRRLIRKWIKEDTLND